MGTGALLICRMHSAAVSIAQPHNQTAISVSALVVGWYAVIRSTLRLAVADGKRTILSFIYLLLFKEKTPPRGEKLQTAQCQTLIRELRTSEARTGTVKMIGARHSHH